MHAEYWMFVTSLSTTLTCSPSVVTLSAARKHKAAHFGLVTEGWGLHLVKPAPVIKGLPKQLDRGLSVVFVHKRHVHVVDEVDQPFGAGGTKAHACTCGLWWRRPCPAYGIDCLVRTCRLDTPDFFSNDCSRMV